MKKFLKTEEKELLHVQRLIKSINLFIQNFARDLRFLEFQIKVGGLFSLFARGAWFSFSLNSPTTTTTTTTTKKKLKGHDFLLQRSADFNHSRTLQDFHHARRAAKLRGSRSHRFRKVQGRRHGGHLRRDREHFKAV